ncbi:hypothetical protein ACFLTC_02200 [Chloroflexota bacterium]
MSPMDGPDEPRQLRVIISDEETGEEVVAATGVESIMMLLAPDRLRGEPYRRVLIGDISLSVELLLDILQEGVAARLGLGTLGDLTDLMDDELLVQMTEELPQQ